MAGFTYQCQAHSLNCSTTCMSTKRFWKGVSFIFKINTASHPVNLSNLKIMQIFNLNQYLRAILESSKGYDFGFFGFLLKLLYNVVLVSLVQQSESVIHVYIYPLLLGSHIGHFRVLNKVPCAWRAWFWIQLLGYRLGHSELSNSEAILQLSVFYLHKPRFF